MAILDHAEETPQAYHPEEAGSIMEAALRPWPQGRAQPQGKVECLDAIGSMLEESSRFDFYRS